MLETGIVVFLAFWLLWIKLSIVTRLKLLGRPFLLDLAVTVAVFIMYSGTATGMLAASVAAVVMSINISVARRMFGHYEKRDGEWFYIVGKINQADKIRDFYRRRLCAKN